MTPEAFTFSSVPAGWAEAAPQLKQVYDLLKAANIKFFTYVPDGGHKQLIIRCNEDPDVTAVPLTIETEGVAFGLLIYNLYDIR